MTFDEAIANAVAETDDEPLGVLRAELKQQWEAMPNRFEREMAKLVKRHHQGDVDGIWALLRWKLNQAAGQPDTGERNDRYERDKQERLAAAWLANAGGHCDRWEDAEDEIFERYLKPWAADALLHLEMRKRWEHASMQVVAWQEENDWPGQPKRELA